MARADTPASSADLMTSPAAAPTASRSRTLTYLGIFLIAQATLMLEVLLTRITSVSAWYHLAFFVISLGMLGMTAGAVLVFLWPKLFADADIPARLAQSALGFALAIPLSVAISLSVPLSPVTDFMSFVALAADGCVLAAPFTLGGVTLTLALTRAGLPASFAYGVDLVGAASGCALVIPVLAVLDAPSAAILAGAIAAAGACAFAVAAQQRWLSALIVALGLCVLSFGNARAPIPPLRPAWVKGGLENPGAFMYTRWNTYSRVTVEHGVTSPPWFWAKGRNTPAALLAPLETRFIRIDGAAGTAMVQLGKSPAAHGYLDWDITAAAHYLRPTGPAAIIGVGGGRDVLEAVRVGHHPVVGVELNDLIVNLHRKQMASFSGLAALPAVELVSDEARSYLARDRRRYSVITMSLIDTWASTGTGAYSLSENGLYTADAWRTFLRRLEPNGILSVSRWFFVESPGETARMLALAMETAWSIGARNPSAHIVLLQNEIVATLLMSPTPFSAADLDRVQQLATEKGFNIVLDARALPLHPMLHAVAIQPNRAALERWASRQALDMSPPTDARPFFFNMLRPDAWLQDRASVNQMDLSFLGNLQATQTLLYATLVSLLLSLLTLVLPMVSRVRELRAFHLGDVGAALGYFALIGLGFMFVEMGLLSRLNVFLGHPTLALAVLLGGLIFFTGLGSMLSSRIDVSDRRWACAYPLIPGALVLLAAAALLPLMHAFEAAPTPIRIAVSIALLIPPALGLGLCFPLGLRLTERMELTSGGGAQGSRLGPWLWGINGAFGVSASGLALATSMVWGIPFTLLLGAGCYLLLPLMTWRLSRAVRS
jgi:spermidine synthase